MFRTLICKYFLFLFFISVSLSVCAQQQQRKFIESVSTLPQSFMYYPRIGYQHANSHAMNRSYDGTNNNIGNAKGEWGASNVQLYREMVSAYGTSDTKNAMNGETRPSARLISNVVCDEPVTQFNSRNLSAFIYVWGQFIDHDITLTPTGTTEEYDVQLPADEPLFTLPIPFSRSEVRAGTGVSNARQQSNLNTAWIDASVVYGSDSVRAKWLRTMQNGKMKMSAGNLLPYNTVNGEASGTLDPNAPSMANDADHTVKTFVAGDVRASEHPGILSLHTVFVREHNRICNLLVAQGFTNDEEIFQMARKQVSGIIQAITYNDFLPALGITLHSYNGYNSSTCPDIMNTFATAAFRLGHTMVADDLSLRNNDCEEVPPGEMGLDEVFFTPQLMVNYGPELFLKGFATHKQYETDTKINSVLRNFLFGNVTDPVRFGLDLAALNIQRGRDHGLPDYNTVRAYYTGSGVTSFSQITSNAPLASALQTLYGTVNNIDLWVGLLAEDRLPNKSVGKTIHAMLKSQFEKLRDGDYYFYKNDPAIFSTLRNQINATKLSAVIKRNTTLTNLQSNVFLVSPCPGENGEDRLAAEMEMEFSIYPNPVQDALTVKAGEHSLDLMLEIFNTTGALVSSHLMSASEQVMNINTGSLLPGIYMLNISGNSFHRTFKFLKSN
jgi:peroxidase